MLAASLKSAPYGAPSLADDARGAIRDALAKMYPSSLAVIEELARSERPGDRLQAALTIRSFPEQPTDTLSTLLSDEYPIVRYAAIESLRAAAAAARRARLAEVGLADPAPQVRRAALRALRRGSPSTPGPIDS